MELQQQHQKKRPRKWSRSVVGDDGVGVGVGLIVRASRHLVGWGGGDKTQSPSDRASGLGSPETTIDDG